MEEHCQTLKLAANASIEDARNAYHTLAAEYHPDNVSDVSAKYHSRRKLIAVDKAYQALLEHFYKQQNTPASERKLEYYYSDVELLEMAKIDQASRREQPRGAIRVRLQDNLPAGLYEEYERVRIRNLGYIFDGEATVSRGPSLDEATVGSLISLDTIYGSPTFKNTIFTKAVSFKPRKLDSPKHTGRAVAQAQALQLATFQEETVFQEDVVFDVRAVFEGPVLFMKKATFRLPVAFYAKPTTSAHHGFSYVHVNHVWETNDA
jgi:hypothetical protein